jgi:hypothetical protein
VIVCLMSVCAYGYDFQEEAELTDRELASEIPEIPGEYVISFQNEHFIFTDDTGASHDIIKALELALKHLDDPSYRKRTDGIILTDDLDYEIITRLPSKIDNVESKIERLEREKKELEQKAKDIEYIRGTLKGLRGE